MAALFGKREESDEAITNGSIKVECHMEPIKCS
jgi:hypothetical protein